jgi:hypothetical protein
VQIQALNGEPTRSFPVPGNDRDDV